MNSFLLHNGTNSDNSCEEKDGTQLDCVKSTGSSYRVRLYFNRATHPTHIILSDDLSFGLGGTNPVTRTSTLGSGWEFPFSGQGKMLRRKQRISLIHLFDSPQYPKVNMAHEWR
jgi:hypothetical protein